VNPWRELGGLPAAAWALAIATFVNRAGSMVLSFLVLFLSKERGISREDAATVASLFGLTSLVIAPIAGRLSDRFGPGKVVVGSLLTGGIAFLLYPLAHDMPWVVVATIAIAGCSEPFRPASLVLATSISPERRRQAVVLQRIAINLGFSVGLSVGGHLAEVDYRLLFWVNGSALLLALLVLLCCPGALAARPAASTEADLNPLADRRLRWFLLAALLVAIVFFQHMAALSIYMVEHLKLGESDYGWTITLNTLAIVLVESKLNAAMAHWRHGRAIALGALCAALGLGSIAFTGSFGGVLWTVPLWTLGEMIMFPTMVQAVTELAPKGRVGATMGYYSMSFSLAFAIGPKLGVTLQERAGPFWMWLCVGALGLVPAAMFLRLDVPRAPAQRLGTNPSQPKNL
jgi:MFS family permease